MKALIIGYGSIGRRHEEVLIEMHVFDQIHIVTRQSVEGKVTYGRLEVIDDIGQYNYFVIASETYKHFEQLIYLDQNVSGKTIFCEKPLFQKSKILSMKNNVVYVGYVLRFHPLLKRLKQLLEKEKVLSAIILAGQYLPTWRKDADYRKSYSAHKDQGGGVLLDLSHEIDYVQWLFGRMGGIHSYQMKISDLEIDSDDVVSLISKTMNGVLITLTIDYISKITYRKIIVHTIERTYELDFVANSLILSDKNGLNEKYHLDKLERNEMFKDMHTSILSDRINVCTFQEAVEVMETISIIQEQNK